ncbi:MAG: class I SAM-dependent methyltransferase [Candidatus Aenigmarchaeota archaeon]|nr:class I SAM-dependent methyltransferase [Candidatus Aenigmarchaeota archaeon]
MGYKDHPQFWQKQQPRVVGDVLNRPYAIELLGDIRSKTVWEVGCGTGYVARLLAKNGALVYGCDREESMLALAVKEEALGIRYSLQDITSTDYEDQFFDAVLCVGVLIHNSQGKIKKFLEEAYRTLKPSSPLVIGVTHPVLFAPGSPSRSGKRCWVQHRPLEDKPYSYFESQMFREDYYDKDGDCFTSSVYSHPVSAYVNLPIRAGFRLTEVKEISFPKELTSEGWGMAYGYPAFIHLKFVKPT